MCVHAFIQRALVIETALASLAEQQSVHYLLFS